MQTYMTSARSYETPDKRYDGENRVSVILPVTFDCHSLVHPETPQAPCLGGIGPKGASRYLGNVRLVVCFVAASWSLVNGRLQRMLAM